MQDVVQGNKLFRCVDTATRLAAYLVDPTEHPLIETGIITHGVEDPLPVLQQAGQNIVQIVNGVGIIRAVIITGAFQTCPGAVPDFLFRVTFTTKQDKFTLPPAGDKRQHRFRFGKPC